MHVPFFKIFNHFSILTLPLLITEGSLSFVFIPYWKSNVLKLNNHWFIFFFLIISRENCNFQSEFAIILIFLISHQFNSVQSLIHVRLFVTPWIAACQASLSITNSRSLPKLMPIESVMPSHPLSSLSPPAPNPSQQQEHFQWVNSSHELAKVLEFQLQHQSFQWTPRTYLL